MAVHIVTQLLAPLARESNMVGPAVGRNEPCPCGSGRKYKHCCLLNSTSARETNPATRAADEIGEEAEGRVFESLEEANAFVKASAQRRNNAGLDEFQGLSPYQMHRLLHFPFDSPDIVRFKFDIDSPAGIPALQLLSLIAGGLGNEGVKVTQTGNLPRALCRDIMREHLGGDGYADATSFGDYTGETDCFELHITRLVAGLAGLVRKNHGRLSTTTTCRTLLAEGGYGTLYRLLFTQYVTKMNWAYPQGIVENAFFSSSFAFSLYLLSRFGDRLRPGTEYSRMFFDAFPQLLAIGDDQADLPELEPGTNLRSGYQAQVFGRFSELFGLAQVGPEDTTNPFRVRTYRASPVLAKVVTFAPVGGSVAPA